MSSFVYIYSVAVLLFLGLIGYLLSQRWKLPHSLVLIILGAVIARPSVSFGIISVPDALVETLVRITLILVVFDIFSRYDHTTPTSAHSSVRSFKLLAIVVGLPILAALSFLILGLDSYVYALLFAALILPSSRVFVKSFKPLRARAAQLIEIETIKVTAYALIVSAIMLFIISWQGPGLTLGLLWGIVIGAGTGLVAGLLFAKPLNHGLLSKVRHLGLFASALITYALAEALGGIAIISVMVLAFFFGSLKARRLPFLYEFSSNVAEFSEIAVFLLLGILMPLPGSPWVFIASFLIFISVVMIRFLLYSATLKSEIRERFILACLTPKDISAAVIAILLLVVFKVDGSSLLLQSLFLIIIYSIALSWIVILMEKRDYGKVSAMSQSDL